MGLDGIQHEIKEMTSVLARALNSDAVGSEFVSFEVEDSNMVEMTHRVSEGLFQIAYALNRGVDLLEAYVRGEFS